MCRCPRRRRRGVCRTRTGLAFPISVVGQLLVVDMAQEAVVIVVVEDEVGLRQALELHAARTREYLSFRRRWHL